MSLPEPLTLHVDGAIHGVRADPRTPMLALDTNLHGDTPAPPEPGTKPAYRDSFDDARPAVLQVLQVSHLGRGNRPGLFRHSLDHRSRRLA